MKIGINRINITPNYKTLMDGYASRQDVNDGINDPLTFTSLILEEKGKRMFIGAIDLVNIQHRHSVLLRKKIAKILRTNFSNVMINCSHTHGSIAVKEMPFHIRKEFKNIFAKNRKFIEDKIINSVKKAFRKMQQGQLFYGEGKTFLPINRRLMIKGRIYNKPNPQGEIDSSLKILKIVDSNNKMISILVRVSCHPVTVGPQHLITADYPGAFRNIFEKYFPNTIAIFLQGIGGDARPNLTANKKTWRIVPYSELTRIGELLFREVLEILVKDMVPIGPLNIRSSVKEVFLPIINKKLNHNIIKERLRNINGIKYIDIKKIFELVNKNAKKVRFGIPLTVQLISFNKNFSMLGIEGEILCGLGKKIEKNISSRFNMVLGCTNGSQCYLLDKKEYNKGGYEVDNYIFHMLPFPLSSKMEDIVIDTIFELNKKVN